MMNKFTQIKTTGHRQMLTAKQEVGVPSQVRRDNAEMAGNCRATMLLQSETSFPEQRNMACNRIGSPDRYTRSGRAGRHRNYVDRPGASFVKHCAHGVYLSI